MSFWPFARETQSYVRIATPHDRAAVADLVARTAKRHGSAALEDQAALLMGGFSTVAFLDGEVRGFLGVHLREPAGALPETWADVALAAIDGEPRLSSVVPQLVASVLPVLTQVEATGMVCLAPDGWLHEGLRRAGFAEEDRVITYARSVGRDGAQEVVPPAIRAATTADTPAVIEINREAFGPFWQYDDAMVLHWMLTSDHSVVVQAEGRVAGFALTAAGQQGGYAHLIRIATDLRDRGRGFGRLLVEDALRYAAETRAPGLALNTQASNTVSRNLYETLGFRQTGHSLAVMVCRL